MPTELFSCILCSGVIDVTQRKIAVSINSDRIQYIRGRLLLNASPS